MAKFPVDAPKARILRALAKLDFHVVREREHISLARDNADGAQTPLTMPNQDKTEKFDLANDLHASGHFERRLFESLRAKLNQHS